jgi:pyrimidine operon attenuation protein/uracil phosphoribosyltransferase
MAHEIVERNHSLEGVSVIGLQKGGEPFARALTTLLADIAGHETPLGLLDVSFYRDDLSLNPVPDSAMTAIDHDLTDRTVVLVDDVLFTGRTIRAAVMVDRGHRELPIRPDYVGKNLPTSLDEAIVATMQGVWIGSRVPS